MLESDFSYLQFDFIKKANTFTGSSGTFRFRYHRTGWEGDGDIHVWVYENICFEQAKDVEEADFPWTEEGVADLRAWLQEKARARGAEPYRIPCQAPQADKTEAPHDPESL